jgi:RND family efflux transporter MFP subunit
VRFCRGLYIWALLPMAMMGWFQVAYAETYDCLIEPMQMVNLSSPITGLLDKVMVKRGDRITKGQVLASLESDAEKAAADLARYKSTLEGPSKLAESKIEFSGRKFKRKHDMVAEKLLSPQESDDAEAEYKQAQAELQVAKENLQVAGLEYRQQNSQLALRTIRSPFDGVVVDQMIYPGEVVEPGQQAILKVAQLNPLRVRVILPNKVFGKPTVGMMADVTPEIAGLGNYVGKVRVGRNRAAFPPLWCAGIRQCCALNVATSALSLKTLGCALLTPTYDFPATNFWDLYT